MTSLISRVEKYRDSSEVELLDFFALSSELLDDFAFSIQLLQVSCCVESVETGSGELGSLVLFWAGLSSRSGMFMLGGGMAGGSVGLVVSIFGIVVGISGIGVVGS